VLKKKRKKEMIEKTGKREKNDWIGRIYLYSLDYNRKEKKEKKSSTYVAHV